MTAVVFGASGFIGSRVVRLLVESGRYTVVGVSRHRFENRDGVQWVVADVCDAKAAKHALKGADIAVNFSFLGNRPVAEHIDAARNMMAAFNENHVSRMIHCSSAVVVGPTPRTCVDENTPCSPQTPYEKIKLSVENEMLQAGRRSAGDLIVVRPTAVFGRGGQNLMSLAKRLTNRSSWSNHARTWLLGNRQMNLVPVENVGAAFVHLLELPTTMHGEVFTISDDECPGNTYRDVVRVLRRHLGLPNASWPNWVLPSFLLAILFPLIRRDGYAPPCRRYLARKLEATGYQRPIDLKTAVSHFAQWYRQAHGLGGGGYHTETTSHNTNAPTTHWH